MKLNPRLWKNSESGAVDAKWIALGFAVLFVIMLLSSVNNSPQSQAPSSNTPQPVVPAPPMPEETVSVSTQVDAAAISNKVTFTKDSNGYDWKKADLQTRRDFCQTVADAESKQFNHDFTSDFYYDALDSFYDSSDPNILSQNIHSVVGLTTSAAISGQ